MNENAVCQKLIKTLNGIPRCYARKRHGGKFQSGDPDIAGVYTGNAFFIELKMENGTLTSLQRNQLDIWAKAGADTRVGFYLEDKKAIKLYRASPERSWKDFDPTRFGHWHLYSFTHLDWERYLLIVAREISEV